jgi:hypothetical protein
MDFKILTEPFEYIVDQRNLIKSVLVNELGNPILRSNLIPKINDTDIVNELNSIAESEDVLLLPDIGEQVLVGKLYVYETGLIKCRQTHNRTIYAIEDIPALFSFFRENSDDLEWIPNEQVESGWVRVYNGVKYEVIQSHQTQSNWKPDNTPSLWKIWVDPNAQADEWTIGVAYKVGDKVLYNGNEYECRQAHTSIASWTPLILSLWLPL